MVTEPTITAGAIDFGTQSIELMEISMTESASVK